MMNERSFIMKEKRTSPKETKDRIRTAAVRVFARDGFDRSNVRSVAEEAGIAVGSIYNHFESKDALLISIFKEEFSHRIALVDRLKASQEPVHDQVECLLHDHFDRAREHRELAELLLYERFHRGSRVREQIVALQRVVIDRIAEILEQGIEQGWVRPCHPRVVAQALFDLVQTMTACWVLGDPTDAEQTFAAAPKELADLMWKGLRHDGEADTID